MKLGTFHKPLKVQLINPVANDGRGEWELLEDFSYTSVIANQTFVAPAGFRTDFMSVPLEIPGGFKLARSRAAGTIHDYLYTKRPDGTHPIASRELADEVLREMFITDLVASGLEDNLILRAEAEDVYIGVRAGGAAHWD